MFWGTAWELMVDSSDRIQVSKKCTDQWAQKEGSVPLVALWVFGRTHTTMVEGQALQEAWKPELEGHPRQFSLTWSVSGSEESVKEVGKKEKEFACKKLEERKSEENNTREASAKSKEMLGEEKDDGKNDETLEHEERNFEVTSQKRKDLPGMKKGEVGRLQQTTRSWSMGQITSR